MNGRDARSSTVRLAITALAALVPALAHAQAVERPMAGGANAPAELEMASFELHLASIDALGPVPEPPTPVATTLVLTPIEQSDRWKEARWLRRLRWGRALMVASAPVMVSGVFLASIGRDGVCYEPGDVLMGARRAGYTMMPLGLSMTFAGAGTFASAPRGFRRDHLPLARQRRRIVAAPFIAGAVSAVLTFATSANVWVECVSS